MLTFIKNFLAKFFSNTQPTVVVVQPTVVEVPVKEVQPEAKPKKRYYKPKATAMSTPVKGKTQPKADTQPAKVAKVKKLVTK